MLLKVLTRIEVPSAGLRIRVWIRIQPTKKHGSGTKIDRQEKPDPDPTLEIHSDPTGSITLVLRGKL